MSSRSITVSSRAAKESFKGSEEFANACGIHRTRAALFSTNPQEAAIDEPPSRHNPKVNAYANENERPPLHRNKEEQVVVFAKPVFLSRSLVHNNSETVAAEIRSERVASRPSEHRRKELRPAVGGIIAGPVEERVIEKVANEPKARDRKDGNHDAGAAGEKHNANGVDLPPKLLH